MPPPLTRLVRRQVRAAVLIMRGNNAAGLSEPVVQIGQHLIHLLPDVIDDISETSVVGMELRELYGYMAEELLVALQKMHIKVALHPILPPFSTPS
eukprot:7759251-Pyramimonas_sp.AAC.1